LVIAGDSRGQQGRVLKVHVKESKAIVEGVNLLSKHTKPTAKHPNGGIIKKEAPVQISNLKLIGSDGKPTRVGYKMDEKGRKVRYSKKSGEVIK